MPDGDDPQPHHRDRFARVVILAITEWVDPGHEKGCGVALGTWKVLRGTEEYAGIAGGGRSAHEALCREWYARQEGFLTVP
jgi:hypothetical protein